MLPYTFIKLGRGLFEGYTLESLNEAKASPFPEDNQAIRVMACINATA
jgi:hypothetical protein